MCSIGADDFDNDGELHVAEDKLTTLETQPIGGICQKCNKYETVVRIQTRDAECKECFLIYVRHKFRASLGSSKLVRKGGEVLVVIDGSPQSIVLLDVLHYAYNQDHFKRLYCSPKILYMDDNFLYKELVGSNALDEIKSILKNYVFESYVVSLASDDKPIKLEEYDKLDVDVEQKKLMKILENIKTLTSKQDLLLKIRKKRICLAARNLKCEYIFLPDITSDLATTLLANISMGYGDSVIFDVGLVDDRIPELKIIRPIKDFIESEVINYIQLNNLNHLKIQKYGEYSENASILNIARSFVQELQQNFPSTASTTFRTGEKLSNKLLKRKNTKNSNEQSMQDSNASMQDSQKCTLCDSNIIYPKSIALDVARFSKLMSQKGCPKDLENINVDEINLDEMEKDIPEDLCYTCRDIYRDLHSKESYKNV